MNKKSILILIAILFLLLVNIFFIFFYNNTAKNLKIGNNTTSQEIVDYILNISSYEAEVEVKINSNKSQNKYILKQQYKNPDLSIQEVIEPQNIAGVKIERTEKQLKIENTKLNLSSVFEDYKYIADNLLDLNSFIKDYKENKESKWIEENNQIIMQVNKEQEQKTLTIDKITGAPKKLEINWTNKKDSVYILYNEVKINSL